MVEEFDESARFYLARDDDGRVTALRPAERGRPTSQQLPQLAANEFLTENADRLGIDPAWFTGEELSGGVAAPQEPVTTDGIELRYAGDKPQFDTTTVAFQQTWRGLPVWRSGVTVTLRTEPTQVSGVANSTWPEIDVDLPGEPAMRRAVGGERGLMSAAIGTTLTARPQRGAATAETTHATEPSRTNIDVVSDRLVVFRYDASKRLTDERLTDDQPEHHHQLTFPFPLPPAPDIEDGSTD